MSGINPKPMSRAHQAFVDTYLADPSRNGSAAYALVYQVKERSAAAGAYKLLRDPRIKAVVDEREKEQRERAAMSPNEVIEHLAQVVKADPRDLIDYRRGACRFCHGTGHQRQRTPQEMRDAIAKYKKDNSGDLVLIDFDYAGGVGFNPNKPPHPDCPECFGHGEGYTYAKDLRNVTPGAARLIAGIKETKDGFEIKVRSQDKNLELYARHLGLLTEKAENPDDNVPPAATVTFNRKDASE